MPLSLSTLADQVGAGAAVLMPLFKRLEAHVLSASRLHSDDTTVPDRRPDTLCQIKFKTFKVKLDYLENLIPPEWPIRSVSHHGQPNY